MIQEFIQELNQKNIAISFANGKLKYRGPEEFIDEAMIQRLRDNKSQLLRYFWPEECINMMPINTEGNKTALAMIHAGASNYAISKFLGKDRPYYGFFNIGSEGENKRFQNVEEFASYYLKQLKNIVPESPYYLGGFSFGGYLAYEVAIQLQKHGEKAPLLFLGDPGLFHSSITKSLFQRVKRKIKNCYYTLFDIGIKALLVVISSLYSKIPLSIRRNYIVWTYMTLQKKYRPSEKYHGKIVLFRAEENRHVSQYLGWENLCDNIELYTYKGGHGAMYDDKEAIEFMSNVMKKEILKHEQ